MKRKTFFPALGIFFFVLACTKPGVAPTASFEPEEETPVMITANPYAMPTPDSRAFAQDKTKCGVNQYWYKYCGYASAQKDSSDWVVLPSFFRFDTTTSGAHGAIQLYTYGPSGYPTTRLAFSWFSLRKGVFLPIKEDFPSSYNDLTISYRDLNDACSFYTIYKQDTTKLSFLQVLDYDPVRKEIKARFRAHLKLKYAIKPGYPETLTFDDGVIFARSIN